MKKRNVKIKSFVILLLIFCLAQVFAASCGDVNTSGSVDILDALLIAQNYVGINTPNFDQAVADVNGDEVVDIIDALLVAQYYVKLIDTLDGCEPDITSPPTIEPTPDGEEKTCELQAETEATFSLTIGSNKIRLTATASAGAANINITN